MDTVFQPQQQHAVIEVGAGITNEENIRRDTVTKKPEILFGIKTKCVIDSNASLNRIQNCILDTESVSVGEREREWMRV